MCVRGGGEGGGAVEMMHFFLSDQDNALCDDKYPNVLNYWNTK